jgi:HSP20 family protein
MSIISYDPFRNIGVLQREINRLFDRDFQDSDGMLTQWPLRVDIREDAENIVVRADIPGMEQKDIQVNVENGRLTIAGERSFADESNREQYHRIERAYGRFSRSFQLPGSTDVERIQAAYRNGVLEIVLPKKAESKPRTIQVAVQG